MTVTAALSCIYLMSHLRTSVNKDYAYRFHFVVAILVCICVKSCICALENLECLI